MQSKKTHNEQKIWTHTHISIYVCRYDECTEIREKGSHDFEGEPEGLYGRDLR